MIVQMSHWCESLSLIPSTSRLPKHPWSEPALLGTFWQCSGAVLAFCSGMTSGSAWGNSVWIQIHFGCMQGNHFTSCAVFLAKKNHIFINPKIDEVIRDYFIQIRTKWIRFGIKIFGFMSLFVVRGKLPNDLNLPKVMQVISCRTRNETQVILTLEFSPWSLCLYPTVCTVFLMLKLLSYYSPCREKGYIISPHCSVCCYREKLVKPISFFLCGCNNSCTVIL